MQTDTILCEAPVAGLSRASLSSHLLPHHHQAQRRQTNHHTISPPQSPQQPPAQQRRETPGSLRCCCSSHPMDCQREDSRGAGAADGGDSVGPRKRGRKSKVELAAASRQFLLSRRREREALAAQSMSAETALAANTSPLLSAPHPIALSAGGRLYPTFADLGSASHLSSSGTAGPGMAGAGGSRPAGSTAQASSCTRSLWGPPEDGWGQHALSSPGAAGPQGAGPHLGQGTAAGTKASAASTLMPAAGLAPAVATPAETQAAVPAAAVPSAAAAAAAAAAEAVAVATVGAAGANTAAAEPAEASPPQASSRSAQGYELLPGAGTTRPEPQEQRRRRSARAEVEPGPGQGVWVQIQNRRKRLRPTASLHSRQTLAAATCPTSGRAASFAPGLALSATQPALPLREVALAAGGADTAAAVAVAEPAEQAALHVEDQAEGRHPERVSDADKVLEAPADNASSPARGTVQGGMEPAQPCKGKDVIGPALSLACGATASPAVEAPRQAGEAAAEAEAERGKEGGRAHRQDVSGIGEADNQPKGKDVEQAAWWARPLLPSNANVAWSSCSSRPGSSLECLSRGSMAGALASEGGRGPVAGDRAASAEGAGAAAAAQGPVLARARLAVAIPATSQERGQSRNTSRRCKDDGRAAAEHMLKRLNRGCAQAAESQHVASEAVAGSGVRLRGEASAEEPTRKLWDLHVPANQMVPGIHVDFSKGQRFWGAGPEAGLASRQAAPLVAENREGHERTRLSREQLPCAQEAARGVRVGTAPQDWCLPDVEELRRAASAGLAGAGAGAGAGIRPEVDIVAQQMGHGGLPRRRVASPLEIQLQQMMHQQLQEQHLQRHMLATGAGQHAAAAANGVALGPAGLADWNPTLERQRLLQGLYGSSAGSSLLPDVTPTTLFQDRASAWVSHAMHTAVAEPAPGVGPHPGPVAVAFPGGVPGRMPGGSEHSLEAQRRMELAMHAQASLERSQPQTQGSDQMLYQALLAGAEAQAAPKGAVQAEAWGQEEEEGGAGHAHLPRAGLERSHQVKLLKAAAAALGSVGGGNNNAEAEPSYMSDPVRALPGGGAAGSGSGTIAAAKGRKRLSLEEPLQHIEDRSVAVPGRAQGGQPSSHAIPALSWMVQQLVQKAVPAPRGQQQADEEAGESNPVEPQAAHHVPVPFVHLSPLGHFQAALHQPSSPSSQNPPGLHLGATQLSTGGSLPSLVTASMPSGMLPSHNSLSVHQQQQHQEHALVHRIFPAHLSSLAPGHAAALAGASAACLVPGQGVGFGIGVGLGGHVNHHASLSAKGVYGVPGVPAAPSAAGSNQQLPLLLHQMSAVGALAQGNAAQWPAFHLSPQDPMALEALVSHGSLRHGPMGPAAAPGTGAGQSWAWGMMQNPSRLAQAQAQGNFQMMRLNALAALGRSGPGGQHHGLAQQADSAGQQVVPQNPEVESGWSTDEVADRQGSVPSQEEQDEDEESISEGEEDEDGGSQSFQSVRQSPRSSETRSLDRQDSEFLRHGPASGNGDEVHSGYGDVHVATRRTMRHASPDAAPRLRSDIDLDLHL